MISAQLKRRQRIYLTLFLILTAATAAAAMTIGPASIEPGRILPALFGDGTFKEDFVLFSIRLPRVFITFLAGAALALSGSLLQGITRNDLADPGIIGINSGAGLAIAVLFLFIPVEAGKFVYLLPVVGFAGALLTAVLIYLFAWDRKTGLQPVRLVLIGVGFSLALSGAMIVLMSSAEQQKVDFIAKWIAGNVWGSDWTFVLALAPWLIILVPFAFYKASRLNLLSLSEPVAIGIGVSVQKERTILLLTAVALAASAVSVTGGIAFIGLMAPHIAKALVGPRSQLHLPLSIVLGGWLLLFADTLGRNITDAGTIPAGLAVALIGAPYFLYLLMKK
ncbi:MULTISPECIES: FecCD family ABC transporter permease [Sporosarcina]|uniref:FecCD family ABC transporter permease n=1 Tax=Sporosarcina TaxID=1569 RepID=UPI00058DAC99|nr:MULTISPECIES: iron ABC transporter permease [Sporosarcina]WJY28389.1 iron ABC transporter permease [Sporosarcina sp. 0.2-SM1T-5]